LIFLSTKKVFSMTVDMIEAEAQNRFWTWGLAASRSGTPALFRATVGTAGKRTGTSQGPAASEEASQRPVFFETLEYREQHPEREQTSSA
jgi:hypothetical protein